MNNLQNSLANLQQQMGQIPGLIQRVSNLENYNKWSRFDTIVDCAAGQTVLAALQQAAAYQSANIGIKGVCHEAVVIGQPNTSLYGVGSGDGLALDRGNGQSVLAVTATGRIGLSNLTLSGGSTGLTISWGVPLTYATSTSSTAAQRASLSPLVRPC